MSGAPSRFDVYGEELHEAAYEALAIAGAQLDRVAEVAPVGVQEGRDRVLAAVAVEGGRLRVILCACGPVDRFLVTGPNRVDLSTHDLVEAAQLFGDAVFAAVVVTRCRMASGLHSGRSAS